MICDDAMADYMAGISKDQQIEYIDSIEAIGINAYNEIYTSEIIRKEEKK